MTVVFRSSCQKKKKNDPNKLLGCQNQLPKTISKRVLSKKLQLPNSASHQQMQFALLTGEVGVFLTLLPAKSVAGGGGGGRLNFREGVKETPQLATRGLPNSTQCLFCMGPSPKAMATVSFCFPRNTPTKRWFTRERKHPCLSTI